MWEGPQHICRQSCFWAGSFGLNKKRSRTSQKACSCPVSAMFLPSVCYIPARGSLPWLPLAVDCDLELQTAQTFSFLQVASGQCFFFQINREANREVSRLNCDLNTHVTRNNLDSRTYSISLARYVQSLQLRLTAILAVRSHGIPRSHCKCSSLQQCSRKRFPRFPQCNNSAPAEKGFLAKVL